MTEEWKVLAKKALDIRDKSMALVETLFPLPEGYISGHLTAPLPDPLPMNVTSFPQKYLNPKDFEIVSKDPILLLEDLAAGKISAVTVAAAYSRCAVLAQRTVNNVTEFLPDLAIAMAQKCDEYLAKTGETLGPLHGLPVSLKDMCHLKGRPSNFACAALVDNIQDYDCLAAIALEKAGAVFYQRTTQPLFLMHMECDSNIYGVTLNPSNIKLSCGGSSGGEAAALGFGSSCVGLGTDIGGSIRGPASMCGANFSSMTGMPGGGIPVGWKPTSNLLPVNDCYNPGAGSESIAPAIGPLARTFEISNLVTSVILDYEPYKHLPELSNKPWDSNVYKDKKKLKIGIMYDDGVCRLQPPSKRALDELRSKLEAAKTIDGIEIEVVDFKPYKHDTVLDLFPLYFEDGLMFERSLLEKTGEPMVTLSKGNFDLMDSVGPMTIEKLWELNRKKYAWRMEYREYWNSLGLDLLLCAPHAGTAQPHYKTDYISYTAFLNFLDWPAMVFTVSKVDPEIDLCHPDKETYTPLNSWDKGYFERYDPELFKDAPISLQLAAPRSENEQVIEGFKIIRKVL